MTPGGEIAEAADECPFKRRDPSHVYLGHQMCDQATADKERAKAMRFGELTATLAVLSKVVSMLLEMDDIDEELTVEELIDAQIYRCKLARDRKKAGHCGETKKSTTSMDEPIADPAERAKAVAKILRGRGIWADDGNDGGWCVHTAGLNGSPARCGLRWGRHDICVYAAMSPCAIADAIQAEEARHAQEWAGDKEGAT